MVNVANDHQSLKKNSIEGDYKKLEVMIRIVTKDYSLVSLVTCSADKLFKRCLMQLKVFIILILLL
ncbi:hypothetical protein CXF79_09415 [Colwellia sp. Bg11-28]|nr:hypothetical protein CXF79_09415 [Colwellia sp. Bg11-28]